MEIHTFKFLFLDFINQLFYGVQHELLTDLYQLKHVLVATSITGKNPVLAKRLVVVKNVQF